MLALSLHVICRGKGFQSGPKTLDNDALAWLVIVVGVEAMPVSITHTHHSNYLCIMKHLCNIDQVILWIQMLALSVHIMCWGSGL